jgi:tellurium resistance protein TerD
MDTTQSIHLEKGQRIDLTKTHPGLTKVHVGCGWDVGDNFDVDAFVVLKGGGAVIGAKKGVIFFNNLTGPGVQHMGDNLTGQGEGDDEVIKIDLAALPTECDEVQVCANIFKADERRQKFGMINNAFVRVVDDGNQQEIAKYDLSEDQSTSNGMVFAKLYKKDGEWKFQALGESKNGDIFQIAGV